VAARDYEESRPEMLYVIEDLRKLGIIKGRPSTPKAGKWQVEAFSALGGVHIETISLKDDPRALTGTGKAYDVVALVEAGRLPYEAFTAARGRVAETRGLVLMSGTLWDTFGWYADFYEDFGGPNVFDGVRFSFPAWYNVAVYPGGRDDPEIKRLEQQYNKDEFARLVEARLVPSPARMYPEIKRTVHVREMEYDPDSPVELSVDPGYYPSRYAVLVFQDGIDEYGRQVVRQIDEIWEHHRTHADIIEECKRRPWWKGVEKIRGGHETRAHAAAKSTQEVWEELTGLPFEIVPSHPVREGTMRVRTFLRDPSITESQLEVEPMRAARYFVDPRCTGTLYEFKAYKRKTNRRGEVRSDDPYDKNNDAMDALKNHIYSKFGPVDRRKRKRRQTRPRVWPIG